MIYINPETFEHNEVIETIINFTLQNRFDDFEVSVSIVNDEEIRELNNRFRNVDAPTDVLSFPLINSFGDEKEVVLGDIVISIEKAQSQALEYGHSLKREIGFLTLHGLLHLLGYDHMDEADEKRMFDLQNDILSKVGMNR